MIIGEQLRAVRLGNRGSFPGRDKNFLFSLVRSTCELYATWYGTAAVDIFLWIKTLRNDLHLMPRRRAHRTKPAPPHTFSYRKDEFNTRNLPFTYVHQLALQYSPDTYVRSSFQQDVLSLKICLSINFDSKSLWCITRSRFEQTLIFRWNLYMFKYIFVSNRMLSIVKVFSVAIWYVLVGEVRIESWLVSLQKEGTWKTQNWIKL